jgi:hypothetical protein
MAAFRKLLHVLPWIALPAAGIGVFDWIDYHVKGKSGFFGVNPRCLDQIGWYCHKLDTTNLSWAATVATWLNSVLLVVTIGGALIAAASAAVCAVLLVVSISSPKVRQTGLMSRLADSPWLQSGTWGIGCVLTAMVVLALHWAELPRLAALAIIVGGVLSTLAGAWAVIRADCYRHDRFLASEARQPAERDDF